VPEVPTASEVRQAPAPRTRAGRLEHRFALVVGAVAGLVGIIAAAYYAREGLTLSHYDAKAHLVVARRILDSLTPGWEQVGAVWLPLPHLLHMVPVQIDWLYRTGALAVVVSIACHAVAAAAIASTILDLTASRIGAATGAALFALNPNVLYLQSTPMTEPMLFALSTLQVALFTRWVVSGALRVPRAAAWVTVFACLTRYEAWPITAACVVASAFAWWRRGQPLHALVAPYARLMVYPALTVAGFAVFSRITVGAWFVSGGFFVPDPSLQGQPVAVISALARGVSALGGEPFVWLSAIATLLAAFIGLASPGRAPMLIALSLVAAAALPVSAYLSGHPFRIRYEVALIVSGAVAIGLVVGLLRRSAVLVGAAVLAVIGWHVPPLSVDAPMVREAQLDPNVRARAEVTSCLIERYRGGAVMASMGSLGHYMHEMSAAGFAIRDFLHEGNGPIWDSAFTRGPAALVEWVLIEEAAEGGDAIAQRFRQVPALLEPFRRVCAAGGVALYQRIPTVAE
jgi:hypothetical protein